MQELDSSRFRVDNHTGDNSLLFIFYLRDALEILDRLGYDPVGYSKEPEYSRIENGEPLPGIMLCDLYDGKEFWFHVPMIGLQTFLSKDDTKKVVIGSWGNTLERLMEERNARK